LIACRVHSAVWPSQWPLLCRKHAVHVRWARTGVLICEELNFLVDAAAAHRTTKLCERRKKLSTVKNTGLIVLGCSSTGLERVRAPVIDCFFSYFAEPGAGGSSHVLARVMPLFVFCFAVARNCGHSFGFREEGGVDGVSRSWTAWSSVGSSGASTGRTLQTSSNAAIPRSMKQTGKETERAQTAETQPKLEQAYQRRWHITRRPPKSKKSVRCARAAVTNNLVCEGTGGELALAQTAAFSTAVGRQRQAVVPAERSETYPARRNASRPSGE